MRKILLIGLISVTTLAFVGCFGDNDKKSETGQGVTNEKVENKPTADDEKEQEDKSTAGSEQPKENEKVEPEVKPEQKEDKTERIFKTVTKDVDYNVVKGEEVKTVGLGVADNIKKIVDVVSKSYFDGNKIELTNIETENNKKIAVVNLAGDKAYWESRMQGSLGGAVTEYTLIENILQREYSGYWIDGVKFTLGGNTLVGKDHVPQLSQIIYR